MKKAKNEILAQGVSETNISLSLKAQIRYEGTDTALLCDWSNGNLDLIQKDFETRHRQQYGFVMEGKDLVCESIAVWKHPRRLARWKIVFFHRARRIMS